MHILATEIFNILSIGHIKFKFSKTGLLLFDGWNEDDNTANGAGKSAIFNAIAFAIYGKIPRKITMSEILRRGTKRGFSKVFLKKNDDEWSVERHRPNKVTYIKNGDVQNITQEAFEKEIGLTYSQFLITMYAAQVEGCKLISINDTGKKDFFLQLMNLERFASSKKDVDADIKEIEKAIEGFKTSIEKAESNIEIWSDQLIDREELTEQIDALDCTSLVNEQNELRKIPRPDLSRYRNLESKVLDKLEKLTKYQYEEQSLVRELKPLQRQLDDMACNLDFDVKCPHCEEGLYMKDGSPLSSHGVHIAQQDKAKKLTSRVTQIESRLVDLGSVDEEKEKILSVHKQLKDKMIADSQTHEKASKRYSDLGRVIAERSARLQSLTDKANQAERASSKIGDLHNSIAEDSQKLSDKSKEAELLKTVSSILSSTGAPAYIMDSVVDVFNDKMADYVNMIWPNATYRIQTFKETKNGEIRAKFSEQLVIGGQSTSVGALSGGEYRCMSLAMDFAVIDVLESMFNTSVNPIILDEPFEGLDASNRERVVELLEKVASSRQIVVIDHASEAKAMFSNVAKVIKRNGVSMLT